MSIIKTKIQFSCSSITALGLKSAQKMSYPTGVRTASGDNNRGLDGSGGTVDHWCGACQCQPFICLTLDLRREENIHIYK